MPRTSARRRPAREGGFTLIEISIAVALMGIVVVSLLTVFESAQKSQAFITDRSEGLDNLRVAMDRMTKDIRQSTAVSASSSASSITITTYVNGVSTTVTWQDLNGTLERIDAQGHVDALLLHVASPNIFTYTPSVTTPNIVKVDLTTTPKQTPNTVLELTSEIRLRNI